MNAYNLWERESSDDRANYSKHPLPTMWPCPACGEGHMGTVQSGPLRVSEWKKGTQRSYQTWLITDGRATARHLKDTILSLKRGPPIDFHCPTIFVSTGWPGRLKDFHSRVAWAGLPVSRGLPPAFIDRRRVPINLRKLKSLSPLTEFASTLRLFSISAWWRDGWSFSHVLIRHMPTQIHAPMLTVYAGKCAHVCMKRTDLMHLLYTDTDTHTTCFPYCLMYPLAFMLTC